MPEDQPVVDEELTAEDAEQNNPGNNIRDEVVQTETRRNLPRSFFKENQHERNQCHVKRVELRQPRNNDRREAVAARRVRRNRVLVARNNDEAAQTADRTRDQHRPERNFRYVNPRVARRVPLMLL